MSAFINRKPWATALLALIFGPIAVMLYLGKGRAALLYLALTVLIIVLMPFGFQISPIALTMETGIFLTALSLHAAAAVHGVVEARGLNGSKPRAWFARWYAVIGLAIILPNLATSLNRAFLWEPFTIPSGSNKPSLRVGDFIFVSKYAYGYSRHSFPFSPDFFSGRLFFSAPEYGDIAVFKDPRDSNNDYVKRIVGLPGDKIQVVSGTLHINGEAVERTLLEAAPPESAGLAPNSNLKRYRERLPNGVEHDIYEVGDSLRLDNTRRFEVPDGHYFVMGDNRDNSQDSRAFGPIPVENLVGRLAVILWNDQEQRIRFWD